MKRLSGLLIALVMLLLSSVEGAGQSEPDSLGHPADTLSAEERAFQDSIQNLNEANRLRAEALTFYNEGISLYKEKRLQEAILKLTQALNIMPALPDAWYNRAVVQSALGQYDAALADLDSLQVYDPDYLDLALVRSGFLMEAGRYQDTKEVLNAHLHRNPNDTRALHRRGTALFLLDETEAAAADFQKASSLDASFAAAWNDLASAYRKMGQAERALGFLQQALKAAPGAAYILNNYGSTLRSLERNDEALKQYEAAIKADPDYALAYVNQASLLIEMEKLTQAAPLTEAAVKRFPGDAAAWNLRGVVLRQQGNLEASLKAFDTSLGLQADYATALLNRAISREEAGDGIGACADYKKAADLGLEIARKYLDRECN